MSDGHTDVLPTSEARLKGSWPLGVLLQPTAAVNWEGVMLCVLRESG